MKRKCVVCGEMMDDNCYINDKGTSMHSYFELIVKNEDYKKDHHEIKTSYCKKCGHIEMWIDTNKEIK